MIMSPFRGALGAAACLTLSSSAFAHVTLERPTAVPDSEYRAVFQVNHGCGRAATTAISVTIPDGVIGVRPMPKAGWTLAIRKSAFSKPYRLYGEALTEGAREVTWSGGTIPDDQYDEFTLMGRVTEDWKPGATAYFPVVQTCGDQASRWTETPTAGEGGAHPKWPAPGVRIVDRTDLAQGDGMAGMHDMSGMGVMAAQNVPPAEAGAAVKAPSLTIEQPWMRATPGGAKVAGGYVRIINTGTEPDRLVGASIPLARRGEVHQMSTEGGIMKMHEVEGGLEIKPGQTVELRPGGYHLMFMDLTGAPKQGEPVRGSLTFAKAGTVEVTFAVAGIGAQAPASPAK